MCEKTHIDFPDEDWPYDHFPEQKWPDDYEDEGVIDAFRDEFSEEGDWEDEDEFDYEWRLK